MGRLTSGLCVCESMTGSHVPLSPDNWMYTVVELIVAWCFLDCKTMYFNSARKFFASLAYWPIVKRLIKLWNRTKKHVIFTLSSAFVFTTVFDQT